MSIRAILKGYFQTTFKPTQAQFEDLIDSVVHLSEDKSNSTTDITTAVDNKYVTPLSAKASVLEHAPIKKINGAVPAAGNALFKTVNSVQVVGSGNIAIIAGQTKIWAMPKEAFNLSDVLTPQNVFPPSFDEFSLQGNKTYLVRGTYILNMDYGDHKTFISWKVGSLFQLISFDYIVESFAFNTSEPLAIPTFSHARGLDPVLVLTESELKNSIIKFEGILRVGKGDVFIPEITFTNYPGRSTSLMKGSFIEFTEFGNQSVERSSGAI